MPCGTHIGERGARFEFDHALALQIGPGFPRFCRNSGVSPNGVGDWPTIKRPASRTGMRRTCTISSSVFAAGAAGISPCTGGLRDRVISAAYRQSPASVPSTPQVLMLS